MNTSVNPQTLKTERLTDAFQLFNELSKNLSDSYQELQKQVASLSEELAAARTERLKTLIEKEKLADRLQQILAALPAAVIVLNGESRVVDCNAVAINYLGESLIGQTWADVIQRSLIPVFDNPHERQLKNGNRVSLTQNVLNNESGQTVDYNREWVYQRALDLGLEPPHLFEKVYYSGTTRSMELLEEKIIAYAQGQSLCLFCGW